MEIMDENTKKELLEFLERKYGKWIVHYNNKHKLHIETSMADETERLLEIYRFANSIIDKSSSDIEELVKRYGPYAEVLKDVRTPDNDYPVINHEVTD